MTKLIFDCDNTFGIPGCDIDDGLALLYLLGTHKAELLGVTTTYGNSSLDVVHPNTCRMLQALGRTDIPVVRGAAAPGKTDGDAAAFLCEMADRYPGTLSILATGSMTNLRAAYLRDPAFFTKVREISLMGGVTAPLVIRGRELAELNFSCDPEAALCVLTHGRAVSIATGNRCLGAFFPRGEFERRLSPDEPFPRWLRRSAAYWFARERAAFGHDGIYKWDVYAAACLLEPRWFERCETVITPTAESLRTGKLPGNGAPVSVYLPRVLDPKAFTAHIYDTYLQNHFDIKEGIL